MMMYSIKNKAKLSNKVSIKDLIRARLKPIRFLTMSEEPISASVTYPGKPFCLIERGEWAAYSADYNDYGEDTSWIGLRDIAANSPKMTLRNKCNRSGAITLIRNI